MRTRRKSRGDQHYRGIGPNSSATAFALFSGYIADRTGKYWRVTFIGYAIYVINLLVVPAMALVHSWQVAAVLILAERIAGRYANLQ